MEKEVVNNSEIIKPLVQSLEDVDVSNDFQSKGSAKKYIILISLVVILLGGATGYLLNTAIPSETKTNSEDTVIGSKVVKNSSGEISEEGLKDESLFPDKAQGELQVNDGKLTQEGTHILVRPGGAAQTVYLTSSAVDLDKFVGKQVEIWGQTNTAQKAGWLMEVGYVKLN